MERVAALARLTLSDGEADRMATDLDTVLEYVETLRRVETERDRAHLPSDPAEESPTREDRPVEPLDPELALANAPERAGTAFVVPEGDRRGGRGIA